MLVGNKQQQILEHLEQMPQLLMNQLIHLPQAI